MENLDVRITQAVNGLSGQSSVVDSLMTGVTAFGIPLMMLAVALTWWLGGRDRSQRHAALVCGMSFVLGLALNQLILIMVHRMRPYDAGLTHLLVSASADPSFPSDHATAGFAIFWGYMLTGNKRKAALFFAAALMVVISRVYVGTHYASDVLGGAVTALVAAVLVKNAYRQGTRLDTILTGFM
jgi:undecaprenyl-diphosphatase